MQLRLLHVWRHISLLVMLLLWLLSLLLGVLETLLKHLNHMIVLLLITYKLLVEYLVDIRNRLFDFGKHLFQLAFKLWHNLVGHGLFELWVDYLAYGLVIQIRWTRIKSYDLLSTAWHWTDWGKLRWVGQFTNMRLNPWDQILTYLLIKKLCLLLQ